MPVRQRDNKWYWGSKGPFDSRKKAEKVAQAAHASGYVSKSVAELTDFIEKAPFDIKNPFASKPDAAALSPDEAEAEAVPEGNRKYLKEGEKSPENIPELKGKRQGRFYDMSKLGEEHGDEITNVFNDLVDELRELETEEGTKKQKEEEDKLFDISQKAKEKVSEGLSSFRKAEEAGKVVNDIIHNWDRDNPDATSGASLWDDPKFKKAAKKQDDLEMKIWDELDTELNREPPSQEADDYNRSLTEWDNSRVDKKVTNLHEKIGNALIHSFKVNGFQVDDIKLTVDPEMKYASWGPQYDIAVSEQLRKVLKAQGNISEDVINEMVSSAAFSGGKGNPSVQKFIAAMGEALHGQFNILSKEFVMSPSMFNKLTKLGGDLSPEEKTGALSAFGTMVHESLHSEDGLDRGINLANYNEGRNVDNPEMLKEHLHKLFEEAPVELLAKAIVGRRYNSDFVGKNVYEDRETFIDGAGGKEQHKWDGYPEMIPHVAKWALGVSNGDPVKGRALLAEMRTLASGTNVQKIWEKGGKRQAQTVKDHQRMNELSLSFGTYMGGYATKHDSDSDKYAGQASIVAEGLDDKYGKVRLTSDLIVREGGRTHNDDGSMTDDAHLDLMHLVYGTKAIGTPAI